MRLCRIQTGRPRFRRDLHRVGSRLWRNTLRQSDLFMNSRKCHKARRKRRPYMTCVSTFVFHSSSSSSSNPSRRERIEGRGRRTITMPTHHSPLTTHHSPFTIHYSPLTTVSFRPSHIVGPPLVGAPLLSATGLSTRHGCIECLISGLKSMVFPSMVYAPEIFLKQEVIQGQSDHLIRLKTIGTNHNKPSLRK